MADTKARRTRSDKGKARAPYNTAEPLNPIGSANMKLRFANSTSYATQVGIDKSFMYKCRLCGVLFTRIGAIAHYPQECTEPDILKGPVPISPAVIAGVNNFGRKTLPPTIYPTHLDKRPQTVQEPPTTPAVDEDEQEDFSLDINEIAEYLEWITEDRNEARRELEVAKEELAAIKETKLSTEFWATYREFLRE
jgi:hypothetical protein